MKKRTPSEQAVFFERIQAVSDRVRQQIPVAANRVEEFECPARSEIVGDVHIQFYLYHEMTMMFYCHRQVIQEINKVVRDYFGVAKRGEGDLSLNPAEQSLFETHMNQVAQEMALKINEAIKRIVSSRFTPPKSTAEDLLTVFHHYLPEMQQGRELIFDESRMIALFFKSLRDNLGALKSKILDKKPLIEVADGIKELSVLSRYRRDDLPHSDRVHRFYESLCVYSARPQMPIVLDLEALNLLMNDAEHNISETERKVAEIAQKLSFHDRDRLSDELLKARNEFDIARLKNFLLNPSVYDKARKNVPENNHLLYYVLRGHHWEKAAIRTGFCDEYTCLALTLLFKSNSIDCNDILEKVSLSYQEETGDGHTFLVINRDPDSELSDMKAWGEDAIILDPWNNLVCYAKDIDTLPNIYLSFPSEAEWSTLNIPYDTRWTMRHLASDTLDDCLTGTRNPDVKEARILQELDIRSFNPDKEQALLAYFQTINERYPEFAFDMERIQFKWIHKSTQLIQIIPGFRKAVVALDDRLIELIAKQSLSSRMLDFGLLAELLKFKLIGYTARAYLPMPDQVFDIDKDALKAVGSFQAAEAFLRIEETEKSKRHYGSASSLFLERMRRYVSLAATQIKPMLRLKMLDAARVAKDLFFDEKMVLDFPESVNQEAKGVSTNVEMMPAAQLELTVTINSNNQANVIVGTASSQPKNHASRQEVTPQSRAQLFQSFIDELPTIGETLIPYESTSKPYRKLEQFCQRIRDLKLDFKNPEDSRFADELINQADDIRLKGFDYLYFAVSGAWGDHMDSYIRIGVLKDKLPDSLDEFYYYLIQSSVDNSWSVYRTDAHANIEKIEINAVEDLQECLKDFSPDKRYRKEFDKIDFALKRYNLAKPLGFFKKMQVLIHSFTKASSRSAAFNSAKAMQLFMKKHETHFSDVSKKTRYDRYYKAQHELFVADKLPEAPEPFYGTNLAKRIGWTSFEVRQASAKKPWEHFYQWASQDKSGLIAETLLRLGVTSDEILCSLNDFFEAPLSSEEENFCIRYGFVFLSYLPMSLMLFERYQTNEINSLVASTKAKKKELDVSMLEDPTIDVETAYQRYFDTNKLQLNCKEKYKTNNAQQVLADYFFKLAKHNDPQGIALIRSVFFGREDGRDLKTIHQQHDEASLKENAEYTLFMDSPFAQFIYSNNNEKQALANQVFTRQDVISLAGEQDSGTYCFRFRFRNDKGSLRDPVWAEVKEIFRVQQTDDELNFLELISVCKDQCLSLIDVVIHAYLTQFPVLSCFSSSFNTLFDLSQKKFNDHDFRINLHRVTWPVFDLNFIRQFPLEDLIKRYRMFDTLMAFPSKEIQSRFGAMIFELITENQDVADRIKYGEQWITANYKHVNPLSEQGLKNKIIKLLIESYFEQLGRDNETPAFYEKAKKIVSRIIKNAYAIDVEVILNGLLERVEAQSALSTHVGVLLEPEKYQITGQSSASLNSLGVLFAVTNLFQDKPKKQAALLDFLSSPLTKESLSKFIDFINQHDIANDVLKEIGFREVARNHNREATPDKRDARLSLGVEVMYQTFWELDLPKRSIITEAILIPAEKRISDEQSLSVYRWGFDYIMLKLFPNANNKDSDDYLPFCIMKSYLEVSEQHERSYLLAAALMASNKHAHSDRVASVGKKLVSICEHMGPAYIKLAQAIHSHPKTPKHMKEDLSHIKGRANPPTRWNLWRQINITLSDEHKARIKRLGGLLGSASYNQAIEITTPEGEQQVLLMLREGAELDSKKGFLHIEKSIEHCEHPDMRSNRRAAMDIVFEAQQSSLNEMSVSKSIQQTVIAQTLYKRTLSIQEGAQIVGINVIPAAIFASGLRYRFTQRVFGTEFNDLPVDTAEDNLIKKTVAKAVIYMELHNILRGGVFDSDRHGNQLKVDVLSHNPLKLSLGLFDFGEMAIEPPNQIERSQLNHLIVRFVNAQSSAHTLDFCLTEAIDLARAAGQSSRYLMRMRKSMLALSDFIAYLAPQDIKPLLWDVLLREFDLHADFYWSLKFVQAALTVDAAGEWVIQAKKRFLGFFSAPNAREDVQHSSFQPNNTR